MNGEEMKLNYNSILDALNHVVGYYSPFVRQDLDTAINQEGYAGDNWHIYDSMCVLRELLQRANEVNERELRKQMQKNREEQMEVIYENTTQTIR